MVHASEASNELPVNHVRFSRLKDFSDWTTVAPDVVFLELPFGRTLVDAERSSTFQSMLREKCEALPDDAIVCVLTSPADAAMLCLSLESVLRYQLWIAVRLDPLRQAKGELPSQHAALLIFSKYDKSLRHTKTRIAYTFCPTCDKTTKDYGGKKHTYNSYGTLMSDVWRDIAWNPNESPDAVVTRLCDVFGLAPHEQLHHVSLREIRSLQPSRNVSDTREFQRWPAKSLDSQLINDDCLDALSRLPDDSIDFCFADPPYNLDKKYDRWNDGLDIINYFSWCDQWLNQLARVLKPGGTCAVLNIPLWAVRHFDCLRRSLQFQTWIAWEGLSLPVRMIMPAHYSIVCFSKGSPRPLPGLRKNNSTIEEDALLTLRGNYCVRPSCQRLRRLEGTNDKQPIGDLWWDIHRLKHNSRRVDHPCQLPPRLMHRLIGLFTNEGETVLDPFNGAGTTSLCARQMDRNFIGIELSREYHVSVAAGNGGIFAV